MITSELRGTLGALNAATPALSCDDADRVAIQVTGTWAGTITFQTSMDGTNWATMALSLASGTASSTTTSNNVFVSTTNQNSPYPAKFFRAVMTAYTSGTASYQIAGMRSSK